jgi:hypothetical protein
MFDVSDINKTVVGKTDLDWKNKGEDITRCDRLFPQRVNGILRVYYSVNHSELPARLEATKKWHNPKMPDITKLNPVELKKGDTST